MANHSTILAAHPEEMLQKDVVAAAATILKVVRSIAGAGLHRCDQLSEDFLCVSRASYILSHERIGEICFQKSPIWLRESHAASFRWSDGSDRRNVGVEWRCKGMSINFGIEQLELVGIEKELKLYWEKRLIYIHRPRAIESLDSESMNVTVNAKEH